jgi:hypothetical protein
MYAPQHRPGLKVDFLLEEELVLVTTKPEAPVSDEADCVHVDWGPDFALHHAVSFPGAAPTAKVGTMPRDGLWEGSTPPPNCKAEQLSKADAPRT